MLLHCRSAQRSRKRSGGMMNQLLLPQGPHSGQHCDIRTPIHAIINRMQQEQTALSKEMQKAFAAETSRGREGQLQGQGTQKSAVR